MPFGQSEDDRVVKVAGLRSAGAIRVGSIPTSRNGLVAQLVERGAYTFVYTYSNAKVAGSTPA